MPEIDPGTIQVVSRGFCVECHASFERTNMIQPTQMAPIYFCPPGWVAFNVAIEETVLPLKMEAIVEMQVKAMPSDMANDYLEGLKATLPNFSVGFHMCPACLEKGVSEKLLVAIKESFHRSIEKEVYSHSALPSVLEFPHGRARPAPVDSDEE